MKTRINAMVVLLSIFTTACGSGGGSDTPDSTPETPPVVVNPDGRVSEYLIREANQIDSVNAQNGAVGSAYPLYAIQFELQGCDGSSLVIYPWSEDKPNVETECLQIVPLNNDLYSNAPFEFVSGDDVTKLNTEFEARGGFYIGFSGEQYVLEESHVNFLSCPTGDAMACSLPLVNGEIKIPQGKGYITGISLVLRAADQDRDIEIPYLDFLNPNFAPKPEIF